MPFLIRQPVIDISTTHTKCDFEKNVNCASVSIIVIVIDIPSMETSEPGLSERVQEGYDEMWEENGQLGLGLA